MFKIEKYEGTLRNTGFRSTTDFIKLRDTLSKIKPKEAFVIKKEWKGYAHKIVREEQLPYKIVAMAIVGNDAFVRIVRIR